MKLNLYNIFSISILIGLSIYTYNIYSKVSSLQEELTYFKDTKKIHIIQSTEKPLIEPSLIKAIIRVESNNKIKAYNKHTGAVGLMQLTPIVYEKICGMTKEEAFNPDMNIACGTIFMHHLMNKFNGNVEKSLLYYNNGHIITNKEYSKKVLYRVDKPQK